MDKESIVEAFRKYCDEEYVRVKGEEFSQPSNWAHYAPWSHIEEALDLIWDKVASPLASQADPSTEEIFAGLFEKAALGWHEAEKKKKKVEGYLDYVDEEDMKATLQAITEAVNSPGAVAVIKQELGKLGEKAKLLWDVKHGPLASNIRPRDLPFDLPPSTPVS
jgi:hypothetical protein